MRRAASPGCAPSATSDVRARALARAAPVRARARGSTYCGHAPLCFSCAPICPTMMPWLRKRFWRSADGYIGSGAPGPMRPVRRPSRCGNISVRRALRRAACCSRRVQCSCKWPRDVLRPCACVPLSRRSTPPSQSAPSLATPKPRAPSRARPCRRRPRRWQRTTRRSRGVASHCSASY